MDPIIISVAPNGARKTTQDLAGIPVTPEQIAQTALEICQAGAAMVHLHVRDSQQKHTLDVGVYKEAIAAIRDKVGNKLVIQATSEAVGIYTPKQQMDAVRQLQPEAVSLALREFIPEQNKRQEDEASAFFNEVVDSGIYPQYILYSPEEVKYFAQLRNEGKIPGNQVAVLFVLGKKFVRADDAGSWSVPDDVDPFLESFDGGLKLANTHWSICAFGGNEDACMQKAIACGGHVRIGFENNHFLSNGEVANSNAELIKQFVQGAKSQLRLFADADQVRGLLAKTIQK